MSCLMTKPTKWLCAQGRLRSAWVSAQSAQSPHLHSVGSWRPNFLQADSKDSDQTGQMDAQADLRLCWAHMSFCWFCHEAAQIILPLDGIRIFLFLFYFNNVLLESSWSINMFQDSNILMEWLKCHHAKIYFYFGRKSTLSIRACFDITPTVKDKSWWIRKIGSIAPWEWILERL